MGRSASLRRPTTQTLCFKKMKNTSHLFFVVFFAVIIAITFALKILGDESTYESAIPEYSVWVLFILSLAVWVSEKYKKLYMFLTLAGLFLVTTCLLQVLVLIDAQELWQKVFRALVIPFSMYIYITMFVAEKWALIKKT